MAFKIDATTPSGKKSKKNSKTRVHFILDESGSMSHARRSTIDGFNEYINTLKSDKNGNSYVVSLTKFEGGNVERVFTDVDIKKVRHLDWTEYCPCGGTNLNDAIGETLRYMENNKLSWKKHHTLVIVVTDGYENMSREWTQPMVADLIKKKEKDDGWTVTFLGANIDTQSVSRNYSISIDNARSYTTKGMVGTMANIGAATMAYASNAVYGSSMDNVLSESLTGLSESDWMKTDEGKIEDSTEYKDKLNQVMSGTQGQALGGVYMSTTMNDLSGLFDNSLNQLILDEEDKKEEDNG